MAVLLFTLFIILLFILTDIIPMYMNKEWKSLVLYMSMMSLVFVLVFLKQILHVDIPSPAGFMKATLIAIFGEK